VRAGSVVLRGRVVPVLGRPAGDGTVVVQDGRVVYAGPACRAPRVGAQTVEVDVGGGTVLPGLVDAHVHLVADGAPDFAGQVMACPPDVLQRRAGENAARTLAAGTVAVRDLGAPHGIALAVARDIAAGRATGPEVAAAGRALTAPGGHIAYLGVEVRGERAMAAAAREELAQGADGIKLVATGGVLTPGVAVGDVPYEQAELTAAAAVARAEGRWVAAHAIGAEGTRRALRAGATTIEHGVHLDDEAVALMLATGAVLVTTRIALVRLLARGDEVEAAVRDKGEQIYEANIASLRRAARAGVPIAGASDAGTPFNPHGAVAEEAALLVQDIGLPAEQALAAVTRTAATCLGRDDLGHLSPGAAGHLVVAGGDPLDDIRALADVWSVVLAGRHETAGEGPQPAPDPDTASRRDIP
jgi:imidazolonepropionase-like amidohydrolase